MVRHDATTVCYTMGYAEVLFLQGQSRPSIGATLELVRSDPSRIGQGFCARTR